MNGRRFFVADCPNDIELLSTLGKEGRLILLSSNVGFEKLTELKGAYTFYDEFIKKEDEQYIANKVQEILWTWFIDESGNDLSCYHECSLGLSFVGPMEVLLTTMLRYQSAFKNLLNKEDKVHIVFNTEDIFLRIIYSLKREIGFDLYVERGGSEREVTANVDTVLRDANLRKYYLSGVFLENRPAAVFIEWIARLIGIFAPKTDRVLLMPAGKLDSYYTDYMQRDSDIEYVMPFRYGIKGLISRCGLLGKYFYFHASGRIPKKEIQNIIDVLKTNMVAKVDWIDRKSLLDIMDHHIFRYFSGAARYFLNAKRVLGHSRPKLLVASVESWPTHVLVAQAAKVLGVSTAIIPHGLCGKTYRPLRVGAERIFDLCLAFGKNDVMECIDKGVEENRIFVSSFPYFSKFLPQREKPSKENNDQQKVLVLVPDFSNISPDSAIGELYSFMSDVTLMLLNMNCEIIGFKGRNDNFFYHLGFNDQVIIEGKQFRLITGYGSFPQAASDADFVIGPLSTSIMESGLLGIDYYPYKAIEQDLVPSISKSIYKIVYVSKTIDELRENIACQHTYRTGYSLEDLISLADVSDPESLYCKFEGVLNEVMNTC